MSTGNTLASAMADCQDLDHEQIVVRHDRNLQLTAVIALHSTVLGPAAGGCRCWRYGTLADAVADAARLSRGMTFKNALADVGFGGGKSVIVARKRGPLTTGQLHRFGEWVDDLRGRYVTAEDVGMGVDAMRVVAERTAFVSGLGLHGAGGDPSPYTARGVFRGLQAAVRTRLGIRDDEDLRGLRVAVQGLGNVGTHLARMLHRHGARLTVADLDANRVRQAQQAFGAQVAAPDAIMAADVDVFAPCALGGALSERTIDTLRAVVVAGTANNQLADGAVGDALHDRGVLYAPDYVVNAGGIISVAAEYRGAFDAGQVEARVDGIFDRCVAIFARSRNEGTPAWRVAEELAVARLARSSAQSVAA